MPEPSGQDTWVWIDGEARPAVQARVPVLDRGFLYGDSLFETTRTVSLAEGPPRTPLFFDAHLDRLERGAAALGFTPPARALIEQAAASTIARVPAAECYLRIMVTRGGGPLELDPAAADSPRLVVIAKPLHLPDPRLYRDGVSCKTVAGQRSAAGQLLATVKSGSFLQSVLALRAARAAGAYEALLCEPDGTVSEGASANLFVVRDGELKTPPLSGSILPGITRDAVLALCRAADVPSAEVPLSIAEVRSAAEAFLTSSLRGILPMTRLDEQPIGDGRPGPVTGRLMRRYAAAYLERKSSDSPIKTPSKSSPR